MIYLEMARDEVHGGGTWAFPNCVWAPTQKRGGGSWPFWSKVLQIKEGDMIFHLRGVNPHAYFVGYSIASCDGFETSTRPPNPMEWDYSEKFYRANLSGFTPFHYPIKLTDLFSLRKRELESYFDTNRNRYSSKLNLFFVRQAGRLQCLNGAYLSDIDEELLHLLFGNNDSSVLSNGRTIISVQTGIQISAVFSRIGQAKFSAEIKRLYGNRCCFPGCKVFDSRFLVGSHIARWSDNEVLRGHMGNGLCFCLVHDKAFETGMFTLDENFRVFVNPREIQSDSVVVQELISKHGKQIVLSRVKPLLDALLEHWIRVGIEP